VKVVAKIEGGQKVEGLTIFPSFGTSLQRRGRGTVGWAPHQKMFLLN